MIDRALRVGILLALVWIGYEIHQVRDEMPAGLGSELREQIRSMAIDLEKIAGKR